MGGKEEREEKAKSLLERNLIRSDPRGEPEKPFAPGFFSG